MCVWGEESSTSSAHGVICYIIFFTSLFLSVFPMRLSAERSEGEKGAFLISPPCRCASFPVSPEVRRERYDDTMFERYSEVGQLIDDFDGLVVFGEWGFRFFGS